MDKRMIIDSTCWCEHLGTRERFFGFSTDHSIITLTNKHIDNIGNTFPFNSVQCFDPLHKSCMQIPAVYQQCKIVLYQFENPKMVGTKGGA